MSSNTVSIKATNAITFATNMFPHSTPNVLGKNRGVPFMYSPYYYWFKFIQLSEAYERTLKGEETNISKEVVEDFGKVRGIEFEDWWNQKAYLFAEPVSELEVKKGNELSDFEFIKSGRAINIFMPLDWRNEDLKDAIGILVDKYVPKRPQRMKLSESKAKYKLGRKWSIKALHESYVVMKYKNLAEIERLKTGKKLAWADLGIKIRHSYAQREKMKIGDTKDVERRIMLTILTTRAYKRAENFLAAAVTNRFPS